MRGAGNLRPTQKGKKTKTKTKRKKGEESKDKNKTKKTKQTNMTAISVEGCRKMVFFFRFFERRAATVVIPVIHADKGNLRLLIMISENKITF